MKKTILAFAAACACIAAPAKSAPGETDWPAYNGSTANTHYSALTQINTGNVAGLREAWRFDTGEKGGLEASPLVIDGMLFAYTPQQKVIALNAATGAAVWTFNSQKGFAPERVVARTQRGLAYWRHGNDKRILAGVSHYIYAIDATSGQVIRSFGNNGRIDLRGDLRDPKPVGVSITSPGVIYKDLIIVGDGTPESLPAPPGDIRAYDVRSGKLRWTFHTIPRPGEFGYQTWPKDAWTKSGAANNWTGMALDAARGIVYVPTGSAATDWYGADRVGDDLFANSLIALNAQTGKRIWHFQGVHHDLWDRDFPAPPSLVTVRRGGKDVAAVAQTSKQGYLFLFDRVTGKPLFPIEERNYPASTVPGEVSSPTQPFPVSPAPFSRQMITESDLTTRTPEAHQWALEQFRKFHNEGQFTPNMVGTDTLMFPGYDGGGEWGGPAFDPKTHILYINANDVGLTEALFPHVDKAGEAPAAPGAPARYDTTGYHKFDDPQGYPAVATPWGTLNAINLDTGAYLWKIPFGQYPELVAQGLPDTGSESYGGPVVTAGGLLFIGATVSDKKFRAYDKASGKLLWESLLPFPANATPVTYAIGGRQYVVIASGGRTPAGGGVYVAYALPQ